MAYPVTISVQDVNAGSFRKVRIFSKSLFYSRLEKEEEKNAFSYQKRPAANIMIHKRALVVFGCEP